MRYIIVVLVAVAGCATPATTSQPTDVAAARKAIDALDSNSERWIASGSVDSLVNGFYAKDAVFMPGGTPAASGSDAISALLNGFMSTGPVRAKLTRQALEIADSLAIEEGTYTIETLPKPPADTSKPVLVEHGNYVTTFINRNGEWRALYDITASSIPLSAPPAAKATT